MDIDLVPTVNTVLILIMIVMMVTRQFRTIVTRHDLDAVHADITTLQFRLDLVERTSPCEHCRSMHLGADHHECQHDDGVEAGQ